MTAPRIAIVGGGPAGSLLAILLARRGLAPVVVERDTPLAARAGGGRSINLALAARGIAALERAGIAADVTPLLIPMRGRMLHDGGAATPRFLPYGQRPREQIYSVSRTALNALLRRLAADRHGVEYRFGQRCVGVDEAGRPLLETSAGRVPLDADAVFAADGAGSDLRRALAARGALETHEELLDHGYKELAIAATADGRFALEPHALHIWPRGGFMLIALPNPDSSFTATLFLPHTGTPGFATVAGAAVQPFFAREFGDVVPLIHDLAASYAAHPVGILGTVRCRPWSAGRILLIGDAAHAIVPFHGQGMNAAFEDCTVLDDLIGTQRGGSLDWPALFAAFERSRAPDTQAIAEMAIENYREMRADVRDPQFELRAAVAFELERRFPGRFIPRYSMVMFHPEIGYAEAQRRGAIQAGIVRRLTADTAVLADVDFAQAAALVAADL